MECSIQTVLKRMKLTRSEKTFGNKPINFMYVPPILRWSNAVLHMGQSLVGFVALYSDKTNTTMKTNSVTFYTLHV